ncbi:bifunctional hydroxymethylpyrimidine kinase/phosphomethylpyrimidine kinase [Lentilactobacillus sp. IMAU92037]|uniref:bifunctional hydroxymethylpyrimidine kinase/phosphomethylpyrimidine kinase n=1 Tax=Lentilactobacillus TaxID=2767893 RepID=UPI001C270788|nr:MULTISPECIES: bifunctional hydroxymethylpyrimidine kinase/phosphomethylpyrimidine kinase [Lentilactobacillus]MBU9790370.1 bifunctional hydroxymethylpyrimidine kinase/phosphomethylpyrimidine kinase [Lentilactobacillus dabitei]MBV0931045.1 bifunctional hydroxymethylpyrimidine kinase/phosphomethylpyrimidine kinase [Lentilactobacillus dabitei]MDM7516910.1 bifunctional hydroxymethylpyrimidine kinase/phosphomethylpyrimidine kinase [Lentilactobacillus sp. TOM.63]
MINQTIQTLTIAGTDSGGGAGVMADIKTMQERHVFAAAVVVAVTAQNTIGVQDFMAMPKKMIDEQFASVAGDLKIRACKTGMLADVATVEAVVENLKKYDLGPLTVDPVMIAKGGARLLSEDAIATVRNDLLPLADLLTPNLPEAEELTGAKIETKDQMITAAKKLQALGVKNVIIKGGHQTSSKESSDFVLLESGKSFWVSSPRIDTVRTHGTGDTLSSCITAEIAKGKDMETAIRIGKKYVQATIANGIEVGHGHGPLNHWAKISDEEGND